MVRLAAATGSLLSSAALCAQDSGDAAQPVPALPAAVEGAKSYTPQDFVRFAPKTARDMLVQVPGFIIRTEDDRRGLGQASGNILVNGERFSGKSNDVLTELGRIPAEDVIRIDIVDGATLNVPGLSGQVANILVRAKDSLGATFAWFPQARFERLPPRITNGNLSVAGTAGDVDFTLGFQNQSRVNGNAGPEIVTDGSGAVIDRRDERLDIFTEQPKLSLGLKHRSDGGAIANLNGSYQIYHLDADEWSTRNGPVLPVSFRRFHEQEREWNYEIGGDYEFGLGPGRLKLIGLRNYEHSPYSQQVRTNFADGRPDEGQRFEQTSNEAESILRGEYGWKGNGADWQVAIEGAYNVLDVDSGLFVLDTAGQFRPAPLDNAVSTVDEKRAEATLSYGRPLSPKLTLQSSAGVEYSKLSQSGPNGRVRSFVRPKGFISLAWKPNPKLDISAKLTREVGQLNFGDFVAFVNVGGGFGTAGNPELVPTQTWRAELEATRNLGAWGTATARVYGNFYEDVVDVVPIGATGQAPGNLDSARLLGFSWRSTFNLDPAGFKGARIDLQARFQKSRVEDQLTGEYREINNSEQRYILAEFRHDIPRTDWAWGGYYEEFAQAWYYRLDIAERSINTPGSISAFIEHKNLLGLTVRAELFNLLGTRETFTRSFYNGRRTNGLLQTEFRNRDYGPILSFSITGKI